jgi:hypothetical protein
LVDRYICTVVCVESTYIKHFRGIDVCMALVHFLGVLLFLFQLKLGLKKQFFFLQDYLVRHIEYN